MKAKKPPIRKCIACGMQGPKGELIRVVKNKDGEINVDTKGKMNGRGAYFCKNVECLKLAKKKNGLSRAFEMRIEPEIYDKLIEQLENAHEAEKPKEGEE